MIKLGILKAKGTKSLSKPMHESVLQALGIQGVYTPYECSSEELKNLFFKLKSEKINGLNVTIPHKVSIISLLDKLTDRAKLIGAVNTIIFTEEDQTIGDNTDILGFINSLGENYRKNILNSECTVLGNGGASLACSVGLMQEGVGVINILGRNKEKILNFKKLLEEKKEILKSKTKINADVLASANLKKTFLLVNTTSCGMYPDVDSSPLSIEDLKSLPKECLVYDVIYKPEETKLLFLAKSLELNIQNGIEMLVLQGAESLKLWLKRKDVPESIMRTTVMRELRGES